MSTNVINMCVCVKCAHAHARVWPHLAGPGWDETWWRHIWKTKLSPRSFPRKPKTPPWACQTALWQEATVVVFKSMSSWDWMTLCHEASGGTNEPLSPTFWPCTWTQHSPTATGSSWLQVGEFAMLWNMINNVFIYSTSADWVTKYTLCTMYEISHLSCCTRVFPHYVTL